jgi:hypothetical protein
MGNYQFIVDIFVAASCWILGAMLGQWVVSKISWFKSAINDSEVVGTISSDDLLDFDEAEKPFIPVTIVQENGLYYGWFKNNNKFLGQTTTVDELRVMAHEHVVKTFGLRFEFTHEDKATVKQEIGA